MRVGWRRGDAAGALLDREWLITNGLGGYASGTLGGVCTRRYHGYLVAALPVPPGRVILLAHLQEVLAGRQRPWALTGEEPRDGPLQLPGDFLEEFRLELGLPVWTFDGDGVVLEKRVLMPHLQNSVHVTYRLLAAPEPVVLEVRPQLDVRDHHAALAHEAGPGARSIVRGPHGVEIATGQGPVLRLAVHTGDHPLVLNEQTHHIVYRAERARGYDFAGPLWSPGVFRLRLAPGEQVSLIASAEEWNEVEALAPAEAAAAEEQRRRRLLDRALPPLQSGMAAELVLAADQFVISPHTRPADERRAHAEGTIARSVIAGYPWFTDWGRDTMIGLEGLALVTGRAEEARAILRTFARHEREGLIPNHFPDGGGAPAYHTADATLWFVHALHRYESLTGDRQLRCELLPQLHDVLERHHHGTLFGIGVDPQDGLLRQGAEGYQLTWMDAKVDGWVVTPRRGKAVEINALYYSALRLCAGWTRDQQGDEAARRFDERAARLEESFNRRFWNAGGGYLYDVVDGERGDDDALRPNQLLALSLPHAVLARERWEPVLDTVSRALLTPVGLRSLAPGHPDYRPLCEGDPRARDAAYHQGTVWLWLLGPLIDAWLKVHPGDREQARHLLDGLAPHLGDACVGSLSEIFDGDPPFEPRGCVAQAWSVAEALRALLVTSG